MKFALNYSPQAAALLDQGRIQIDLYKCPDWPDLIEKAETQRPVYVHFPLMAGRANIEEVGWETLDRLLDTTETPYINTHLAPDADAMGIPLDTRDPAHTDKMVDVMLRDIAALVRHYGADRIILENAMWDPEWLIARPVLEPTVIRHMVYESGCGFLMDTAHASVTARHFGMDEREYISQLPVDRLCELHITGLKQDEAGAWKDHYAMTAFDWELAEWSMECIRSGEWATPWVVALEYGGVGPMFEQRSESAVIAEQVPRIYALTAESRIPKPL